MKHFKTFFIIDSGDTTGFHQRSMWNMSNPSFGGMTNGNELGRQARYNDLIDE